jgi:hypothetical protein
VDECKPLLLGAAPKMGRELMDVRTEEVRFNYVTLAARVFKPTVPVAHLARVLGFSMVRRCRLTLSNPR